MIKSTQNLKCRNISRLIEWDWLEGYMIYIFPAFLTFIITSSFLHRSYPIIDFSFALMCPQMKVIMRHWPIISQKEDTLNDQYIYRCVFFLQTTYAGNIRLYSFHKCIAECKKCKMQNAKYAKKIFLFLPKARILHVENLWSFSHIVVYRRIYSLFFLLR